MTQDELFMQYAIQLAKEAAEDGEIPVGAVVVKDGVIIGQGRNRREKAKDPLGHAELEAIAQASRSVNGWRLFGCELYVTLEPCPMCTGAIINARLDRVIYGASDPKAGSVNSLISLFELPYNHRPQVASGVLQRECSDLLRNFFQTLRSKKSAKKSGADPSCDASHCFPKSTTSDK